MNLGPHALYRSGRGIQILQELDVPIHGGRPKEAGGFAIRDGKAFTLPAGLRSLLATSLFGLSDKLEAARMLSALPKVDWTAIEDESLEDWMDRNIRHSRVKELLSAVFRVSTYVNAPRRISAGVAINQLQKALNHGVLYLDEGWQSLVDGLRRTAEAAGANIISGEKVASIEVGSAGQVTGVRFTEGRAISSDTVIAAISPRGVASLLGNTTSIARLICLPRCGFDEVAATAWEVCTRRGPAVVLFGSLRDCPARA
jgi:phytoene dehydrogenase-like protein